MEVRRTIFSYDLTAADNLDAVISHPLLKETNYDEWTCGMKTALCSRKKIWLPRLVNHATRRGISGFGRLVDNPGTSSVMDQDDN